MKYPLPKLPNISANGMRSKLIFLHLVVIRHVECQVSRSREDGFGAKRDGRLLATTGRWRMATFGWATLRHIDMSRSLV
jgi:hypothetical protein